MNVGTVIARCWLATTSLLLTIPATATEPVVAIIIDDLGYRYTDGLRAVRLPVPISCAVIPNTPHGTAMAEAAHARGKEVLLHLPMQSVDPLRPVGSDGITMDSTERAVQRALQEGLQDVPHAAGVNNHMGSLITRHPGHMTWLMQALQRGGLFFVDSLTTQSSVAHEMAREQGVPTTRRDLFLDREDTTEAEVAARLGQLLSLARQRGHALGIGHPYPATMTVLERELPRLERDGIRLVTVRELIAMRSAALAGKQRNNPHGSARPDQQISGLQR